MRHERCQRKYSSSSPSFVSRDFKCVDFENPDDMIDFADAEIKMASGPQIPDNVVLNFQPMRVFLLVLFLLVICHRQYAGPLVRTFIAK